MSASEEDLVQLWLLIRRASSQMDRVGDALFRSRLGISLAQFLVLSVVDAYPGVMHQQAIADRLSLTKGSVSRQIEHAVAAGHMRVSVSPTSRREHAVELTESGTALVRKGDALFAQARDVTMTELPADDVAATLRTLTSLCEGLDRA